MNNRENQQVLLFQMNFLKAEKVQRLCKDLNISCRIVSGEDLGETLGYLANIQGFPRQAKEKQLMPLLKAPGEMLVMSGMDSESVDIFLAEYQKRGIEITPLKAMITPYNVSWTPIRLYGELSKEQKLLLNR